MIQAFDNHLIISELDRTKLSTYWNGYLQYEEDEELSTLTKNAPRCRANPFPPLPRESFRVVFQIKLYLFYK